MGSYLTIVNDTDSPWHCKIGPDMVALKWVAFAAGVLITLALTLVTGKAIGIPSAGGMEVAKIAGGIFAIFGVPVSAMGSSVITTASEFVVHGGSTEIGIAISNAIVKALGNKKYDIIMPGGCKRYGKMTLSLWQQSECKLISTSGTKSTIQTLMMRPIFSGSTNGSNRDHSISWWLDKDGTKSEVIEGRSDPLETAQN